MDEISPQQGLTKLSDDWNALHADPPEILYHYTTAPGLLGMLRDGRLWATNAKFLNDPSEVKYAAGLVKEALAEAADKHKKNVSGLTHGFVEWMAAASASLAFKVPQIRESTLKSLAEFDTRKDIYIACFCKNGDLLSQWRGYGAAGGGYAIGFAAKKVGRSSSPSVLLRKVIYERKAQKEIIDRWLASVYELDLKWRKKNSEEWKSMQKRLLAEPGSLRQLAKELAESRKGSKTPPEDVELLMRGWDKFTQFLAECLICFKSPAYVEEQEWRGIQFGYDGQKISFRASGGRIIPYVELDICEGEGDRKGKLPIQCLTFGPTLDPAATQKSIGLLADAYVYPVLARNIRKSEIPYRG